MKYPSNQLEVLQKSIDVLSKHFELEKMHPSVIQMAVFTQSSEGHKHNWLYLHNSGNAVCRQHAIADLNDWTKLFEVPSTFKLYPNGCDDSHIETAVKHCLKVVCATQNR